MAKNAKKDKAEEPARRMRRNKPGTGKPHGADWPASWWNSVGGRSFLRMPSIVVKADLVVLP
jgi:hypothetical protein